MARILSSRIFERKKYDVAAEQLRVMIAHLKNCNDKRFLPLESLLHQYDPETTGSSLELPTIKLPSLSFAPSNTLLPTDFSAAGHKRKIPPTTAVITAQKKLCCTNSRAEMEETATKLYSINEIKELLILQDYSADTYAPLKGYVHSISIPLLVHSLIPLFPTFQKTSLDMRLNVVV